MMTISYLLHQHDVNNHPWCDSRGGKNDTVQWAFNDHFSTSPVAGVESGVVLWRIVVALVTSVTLYSVVNHHARNLIFFSVLFFMISFRCVWRIRRKTRACVQSGIRGWGYGKPFPLQLYLWWVSFLFFFFLFGKETGNSVIPVKNLFPPLKSFSTKPIGGQISKKRIFLFFF